MNFIKDFKSKNDGQVKEDQNMIVRVCGEYKKNLNLKNLKTKFEIIQF